jgi:hypothetical protein
MSAKKTVVPLIVLVLAGSCITPPEPVLERPGGFALFTGTESYQAISPEGVVLELRVLENEPPQDLAFWTEALETHLTRAGYRQRRKESFSSPAGEGISFEWIAPVAGEDWVYLTAFVVEGERIALVEAAGPYAQYTLHRDSLMASLATLALPEP